MKYLKIISLLFWIMVFQNSFAQTYTQKVDVISSGGGESSYSTYYSNFGVLGETFVDYPMIGGNYETSVGFLYYAEGIPVVTEEVIHDNTIRIFPIPANNYLNIEKGNSVIEKIEIYSIFGIKTSESEYSNRINISKLTKGIYFLRIIDTNGSLVHLEKIVIY